MKHLKHLFTVLLLLCSTVVVAHDFVVDGIYYNITDATIKTVGVTYRGNSPSNYSGYSGSVVIPESVTYNGTVYSVTSIGDYAFVSCNKIASITIPNSVTSIGEWAFNHCTGLASITIPNSVTSIGDYAFAGCTKIASITIPYWVTSIGDYAFAGCTKITSITIPDWVTSIGKNAFYDCTGLTSVEFNAVDCTTMGGDVNYPVFEGCTALSTITIGKYVRLIPDYAFYGCSGLTSITIPNSVTSIGKNAFLNCTGLTSVEFNAENCTTMGGDVNYPVFEGCTALSTITIGKYVRLIPDYAFYGCTKITSITIPNSVTSIETGAFDGCTSLKELRIEDGEGTLSLGYNIYGEGLFYNCPLETLYLGRDLSYGYPPFYNIKTLASVIIGNSVTDIGDSAFEGCTGLKTVYNFSNLTFHEGSYNYGYIAFYASDVYNFPNGSLEGDFLFSKPNGVYTLLAYLGNATEITLPADCNGENYVIGSEVFAYNETITSVVIPYRVTSIGEWAFCECTGLTSVVIGNRVTSIGEGAFYGCTGLTSIVIPNNVKSIGVSAFENTAWYNNQPDDVVYAGKVLYNYKGTMPENTSITIKDGTLGIADGAFYECTGLTSITIPNSVTSIGEWAFEGCHRLGTVVNFSHLTFSKGSRSYGDIAYYADKVYNVPNGSVEGNFIFGENTHEYTTDDGLPGTLKGSNHVWESPLLPGKINGIRITVLATNGGPNDEYYNGYPIVALGELEFYDGSGARIYYTDSNVSTNSLEGTEGSLANLNDGDYETFYHSTWSGYGTTPNGYVYLDVKFPSEVDGVKIKMVGRNTKSLVPNHIKVRLSPNNYALKYYIGENSNVVLPAKYKNENYNIADYAFLDNKTITSVTIPNGVTSIGDYAFYDCTRLWTVVNLSNLPLSKGSKDYGYVAYYADRVINSADISGISLDRGAVTVEKNESFTLRAELQIPYEDYGYLLSEASLFTWSTSNSSVATVKDGVVTAVAPGIAIITAKACNYSASCMVSVGNFIPITSLEQLKNNALYYISQPHHTKGATSWAIDKGGKALKSNVDLGVELSSSDTRQQFAILSIDGGAKRYLYHPGEKKFINKDGSLGEKPVDAVNIEAGAFDNTFMFYFNNTHFINVGGSRQMIIDGWSTPDGGNSCTIVPVGEFAPTEVTGISLDKSAATLVEGELLTLKATVKSVLGSLSDMPVTWSTSNSSVATVKDGVVTAVAVGTATITAKAGGYSATCVVTVEEKVITVTGITLSETKVTLTEGETMTLIATVTPSNAVNKTVTWSTTNSKTATVKDGVVTAVAPGRTRITATAGGYSATCVVSVEKFNGITSLGQLKNNALYYISQPHHTKGATSWAVDKGGEALKSNVDLGVELSSSDTRQQFAILSIDGGATRYLYHTGEKKFINKDGSLGEKPVDAVNIEAGAFKYTFMFYFDDVHYINVDGNRHMRIDDWSTPDGGNSCTIVPVGEFDPEVALGIITGIEDIEDVDGEIVVYNLQGNRILDVDNLERGIYIVNGKKVLVK